MNQNRKTSLINLKIKNGKRGNALLMVVILFLAISILTVAMLAMAGAEFAQVIAQEKIDQSYYTARAVVQATSDWISTHYNARDQMELVIPARTSLGEGNAYSTSNTLNGQNYDLKVWRDSVDSDVVHIEATGYYQGQHATARLSLQETISGYALFEDAIYSKGPFGKSSGAANLVTGSVSTGSDSIPDNLNVTGAKTVNKYYDFEDVLPDASVVFPAKIDSASLNNNDIVNDTFNLNAYYGTLNISRDVYIKNTDASGNPQDVHILVENLYINEKAVLIPTSATGGYIFIYVSDYVWCDKKFGIGVYGGDNAAPRTFLICSGIGDISFEGNPVMNAFIYGPDVNVEYGGTTVLNGAVIANVYGWNGNVTVTYRKPDLEDTPFESLNEAQKKVSIMYPTWTN